MVDPRTEAVARILVDYSVNIQPGEFVGIEGTPEGARLLVEFAFGTNQGVQRFTKNILFDEKIGGTVHMALGTGYPETGSQNRSAIHWDIICDLRQGGEVWVEGELCQGRQIHHLAS